MNTANKIENHIRAIFGGIDEPSDNLLSRLFEHTFEYIYLNSIESLSMPLKEDVDQVWTADREAMQKALFPANIKDTVKLGFHSCAISFYIATSPVKDLNETQVEIRNNLAKIRDRILDPKQDLRTTVFDLKQLLHYCRIIDKDDNTLTFKRDLIKELLYFSGDENSNLIQLDRLPAKQSMTKLFVLEPVKFDIPITIQRELLRNFTERNRTTASYKFTRGKDLTEVFAPKTVTFETQIFRTKLDEFTDKLIVEYEKQNKDIFGDFDGLKEFITKQIALSHKAQYSRVLQGKGTNKFTQLSTRRTSPTIDAITSRATIRDEDFTVVIEKYNDLAGGLRVSTHKLLDALTIQLTKQNDYRGTGEINTTVSISLEEFMSLCNTPLTKPSMDKTRRTVKEDLEALYNVSLEWKERSGKKTNDYAKMRIISSQGIKNGQIIAGFSPEIAQYLTHAYVMQYPNALFALDERNEAAYILGRYLAVHASIDNNHTKGTSDIISVKSLLDACNKVIPPYEDVSETDRHFERRIIKPLEKALDSLQESSVIKNWHYCNSKKAPLTKAQLNELNYEIFKDLYVYFEMKNPPDQTSRIEAKALRVTKINDPRKRKLLSPKK